MCAGADLRTAGLRAAADRLEHVDVADEVAVRDLAIQQVALLPGVSDDGVDQLAAPNAWLYESVFSLRKFVVDVVPRIAWPFTCEPISVVRG